MPRSKYLRQAALAAAAVLPALAVLPAPSQAVDDPFAPLYSAVYVAARDVEAEVPCGSFSIEDGVVCFLPGQDKRKEGMFIGDMDLELSQLPREEAVVNRFAEEALARGEHEPRSLVFQVSAAYVNASLDSDSTVLPGGRAVTIRSWDELDSGEQTQFRELFEAGLERGWHPEDDSAQKRDPRGREFYATFWCEEERDGELSRYDLRVDESGHSLAIEDARTDTEMFKAENLKQAN